MKNTQGKWYKVSNRFWYLTEDLRIAHVNRSHTYLLNVLIKLRTDVIQINTTDHCPITLSISLIKYKYQIKLHWK